MWHEFRVTDETGAGLTAILLMELVFNDPNELLITTPAVGMRLNRIRAEKLIEYLKEFLWSLPTEKDIQCRKEFAREGEEQK